MSDTTARRAIILPFESEDDPEYGYERGQYMTGRIADTTGTHMIVTVKEWERLRAENERLKAFIADKIHDATRERMLMEVDGE